MTHVTSQGSSFILTGTPSVNRCIQFYIRDDLLFFALWSIYLHFKFITILQAHVNVYVSKCSLIVNDKVQFKQKNKNKL